MSCSHCVATIEKTIKALDPAAVVSCHLETREVDIVSTLAPERITTALRDVGFETEPATA